MIVATQPRKIRLGFVERLSRLLVIDAKIDAQVTHSTSFEGRNIDEGEMRRLNIEAARIQGDLKSLSADFVKSRVAYVRDRSPENKAALDVALSKVEKRKGDFDQVIAAMERVSGLSAEKLAALDQTEPESTGLDQLPRRRLTSDLVSTTFQLDDELPGALEALQRLLPPGWYSSDAVRAASLDDLMIPGSFLSLTKNARRESEFPSIHRLRQAISVSEGYLNSHPTFDHFAASLLIPTIVAFSESLDVLQSIKRASHDRIPRLWTGASEGVDSVFFELFTAAACQRRGRDVEFLAETSEKSPDLRCHDPFPMVVECKRQRALSDYELSEEALVRNLFTQLRDRCWRMSLYGNFSLRLDVEISKVDLNIVADALVSQRLVPRPQLPTQYEWGTVAFNELPSEVQLSKDTRIYSPLLLEEVFQWNTDLPEADGICCCYTNAAEPVLDRVQCPLGLSWGNRSDQAMKKRTWAPTGLFASAFEQIPLGEDGVVYLSLHEGARADAADQRIAAFQERLQHFSHRGGINVPIAVLCRLFPRALGDGCPDLIENNLQLLSGDADPSWFEMFPTLIFTKRAADAE